ncbi:MAG: hypothetical protein A2Z18_02285 [Armatimonadetes bacterium RBG_16_58_9]|nr:MAG: hypothetical protein A2Z18_02285 [Armatimonadetes bacterium RBG_16_58_9]
MQAHGPRGWIHEIFTSVQGEGIYCGCCHTFVRFARCNLECDYCDTPTSREPHPDVCRVEPEPGTGRFEELANPLTARQVTEACASLPARVAALTGGEPLLQHEFLAELMREMKERGCSTYLETNGTLWEELGGVVGMTDVIAMDIKLPSSTGGAAMWDDHERFLRIASGSEVFVKAVVDARTSEDEMDRCCEIVVAVDRRIPLVIQPVSGAAIEGRKLMALQRRALERLEDVRVIPQVHKVLGIM